MSKPEKLNIQEVALSAILVDQDLQSRESTDVEHVKHLSDLKEMGVDLPAIVLFQDPALSKCRKIYLMADGFHRLAAYLKLGLRSIKAIIIQGTRRDAILYSIGANSKQGKQLTANDRNKAVLMLITDSEWRQWNDKTIARMTGASVSPVRRIRVDFCLKNGIEMQAEVKRIRGGKEEFVTASRGKAKGKPTLDKADRNGVIRAKFPGGKGQVVLSKDPVAAAEKFKELSREWWSEKATEAFVFQHLRHPGLVCTWLQARGIVSSYGEGSRTTRPGEIIKRHPLTPDVAGSGFLLRLVPNSSPDSLRSAFGDAYLWSLAAEPTRPRAIILCFPTKECQEIVDLILLTGVEVMTPEEFVASFASNQHEEAVA
jgi:ParB-like chromosome segregation protein Spo0J